MGPVNADHIEWDETKKADAHFRRKSLSEPAGGSRLGCSLYEVPPGGRDWPYHFHHGNEEAIYVLSGEGVLQMPTGDVPLVAGDYVALPAGPEHAHRVHNRGASPLRFLCMSTMQDPDVAEFPETGRIGVFCGRAPGGDAALRRRSGFYLTDETVDYWG